MRKKLLSVLLCAAMAVSMFAGCGSDTKADTTATPAPTQAADPTKAPDPTATPAPTATPVPTEAPAPAGEAIPEAKYYYPFDDQTGLTVKVNDFTGTSAETRIVDSAKTITFTNGVKGNCAWFDGSYGAELNIEPLDSDTWTISFWIHAARYSVYGPTITFGSDFYSNRTAAKWINVTRTDFDGATFPTIWSRDESLNIWPWYNYKTDVEAGKKEWCHIVLVSDANNMTEDGVYINADMYIDGVLVDKSAQLFSPDVYPNSMCLTPGVFGAADDFHFYLGINCWDTIFKGAMDELYIFDEALTAGQVATLYADGDPSKDPVVEGADKRDHSDVVLSKGKMVGTTDYTATYGSSYSDSVLIPADGVPVVIEFDNYTRGESFDDTYSVILQNLERAHSTADDVSYKEYAVIHGTITKNAALEGNLTRNTFNQFQAKKYGDDTDRAKIAMTITNNGTTADVSIVAVCADGITRYLEYTGIAVDGPVYCCLTTQGGFLDTVPNIKTYGTVLGSVDFAFGFWGAHSEATLVPVGETLTTRLINYSVGNQPYQNWVAVLKNVAGLNETEGYKEYAVVRSDNAGWGAGYDNNANLVVEDSWDWDLTTDEGAKAFINFMQGATVDVSVTNHGTTADVVAKVTSTTGEVHTIKYLNIAIDGDLYYGFTTDGTCLDIIGTYTGKDIVGVDNNTAGWWVFHSEPVAVPAGESVTTKFINHTTETSANWNNFLVVLQNVPEVHNNLVNTAYKEYAVVRADNYGWLYALNTGANLAELGWVLECDWDWATMAADAREATVEVTITNHGTTADVAAVITTVDGRVFHQKYSNIAVDGDLYYCLTVDACWLDILE